MLASLASSAWVVCWCKRRRFPCALRRFCPFLRLHPCRAGWALALSTSGETRAQHAVSSVETSPKCGAHATPMWRPCGAHVAPMWRPCGAHVAPMWRPCGAHVAVGGLWRGVEPPRSFLSRLGHAGASLRPLGASWVFLRPPWVSWGLVEPLGAS